MKKPQIGDIVIYVNSARNSKEHPAPQFAAVITAVQDEMKGLVSLHIFYPQGANQDYFDQDRVPHAETPAHGCWSYGDLGGR